MAWQSLALAGMGQLVSPAFDWLGGKSGEEKAYERFLKGRGIDSAQTNKQISAESGRISDQFNMSKSNIMGDMQRQGLGSSIIGAQAGIQLDVEKSKSITNRARQLYDEQMRQKMLNEQELAEFKLGRGQARKQGMVDFWGGAFGAGGSVLDSYLKGK